MAKHIKTYTNSKFISSFINVHGKVGDLRDDMQGVTGELNILESEHMDPGKKFILFEVDDEENTGYLKTSLGDIEIKDNILTIKTHDCANIYNFEISTTTN